MQITLLKGVKYQGESYKKGQSIEADPKDIQEMIKKKVIPADTEIPEIDIDKVPVETDINKMKVDELKDYAEKNGIDLADATKKDDILAVIKEAEAVANADTTS